MFKLLYYFGMTAKTKKISFQLGAAEHQRLLIVAAHHGVSISEYLRDLVRDADSDWQPGQIADHDQLDMWGVPKDLAESTAELPKAKPKLKPKPPAARSVALQTRFTFTE